MNTEVTEKSQRFKQFLETISSKQEYLPNWKNSNANQRLKICLFQIAIFLPVLVIVILIITTILSYLLFFIKPQIEDREDKPEVYYWHSEKEKDEAKMKVIILGSVMGYFCILLIINYILTIHTKPGSIPITQEWIIPIDTTNPIDVSALQLERKKDGGIRMCFQCGLFKPDRSHHCRLCDVCVLKMDHHCPWVANCIGYYNYKYFFLTVTYSMLALLLFTGTFWETLVVVILDDHTNMALIYYILVQYSLICLLTITISGFWIFHFYLIISGYSTIEYCEKKVKKFQYKSGSPYNHGKWKNLQIVLGNNPLLWPFPTSNLYSGIPKYEDAGIKFEVNHQNF